MPKCPKCESDNLEDAQYCQECGEKLVKDELKVTLIIGIAGLILGIIIAPIFFIIPFIMGIYLLTRSSSSDKLQGKLFILFSVALFIIILAINYFISKKIVPIF
jgi:hypothetical protein